MSKAIEITAEDVQNIKPTDAELEEAKRMLKKWGYDNMDPALQKLYSLLFREKNKDGATGRVTKGLIEAWKKRVIKEESLSKTVQVVPINNLAPGLMQKYSEYIIPRDKVVGNIGIDLDRYQLIDSGILQLGVALGPNVYQKTISIKLVSEDEFGEDQIEQGLMLGMKSLMGPADLQPPIARTSEIGTAASSTSGVAEQSANCTQGAGEKARGELKAQISDPPPAQPELTENESAKIMIKSAIACIKAKKIVCGATGNSNYLGYWWTDYCKLMTRRFSESGLGAEAFVDALPFFCKEFVRQVMQALLQTEMSREDLTAITTPLKDLVDKLPKLATKMGAILVQLGSCNAEQDFDRSKLDLENWVLLSTCAMYKRWVRDQTKERIEKAEKDVDSPDASRHDLAKKLLACDPDEGEQRSLNFAVGYFGALPDKMEFLTSEGNFENLQKWKPKDPRLASKKLYDAEYKLKECSLEEYTEATSYVLESEAAADKVVDPIVRAEMKSYFKISKLDEKSADMRTLAKAIFLECSQCKLGISGTHAAAAPLEYLKKNENEQHVRAIVKILGASARKVEGPTTAALMGVLSIFDQAAAKVQAEALAKKAAAEQAAAKAQAEAASEKAAAEKAAAENAPPSKAPGEVDEPEKPEDAVKEATANPDSTAAPAEGIGFNIGDIVITSLKGSKKELYDGYKAQVLKLKGLKSKNPSVEVRMIEGPASGITDTEVKDFTISNVKLAEQGEKRPALAPPAGTETSLKKAKVAAESAAEQKKTQEAEEEEARDLFGDLFPEIK